MESEIEPELVDVEPGLHSLDLVLPMPVRTLLLPRGLQKKMILVATRSVVKSWKGVITVRKGVNPRKGAPSLPPSHPSWMIAFPQTRMG